MTTLSSYLADSEIGLPCEMEFVGHTAAVCYVLVSMQSVTSRAPLSYRHKQKFENCLF